MALVKCPDCGKMISEQAPVCIQCGGPITHSTEDNPCSDQSALHHERADINDLPPVINQRPIELVARNRLIKGMTAISFGLFLAATSILFSSGYNPKHSLLINLQDMSIVVREGIYADKYGLRSNSPPILTFEELVRGEKDFNFTVVREPVALSITYILLASLAIVMWGIAMVILSMPRPHRMR